MPSIKKNIIYSSILTVANYLFPLITYPYVTRVLGVANLGLCNFADSIISYYILFSMMGMTTLGIREIAKVKANKQKLSGTFSSLLSLNFISTIIVVAVLAVSIMIVPKFKEMQLLLNIGIIKVIFNFLLIEWFYRGLENFKYITVCSILVRIVYVFCIFCFVKTKDDYVIYYILSTITIVISALVNLIYSRKFIKISLVGINIRPYVKPFLVLGIYALLTSMYTSFNVAYLGFVSGEVEVGYYTAATKIHSIVLSIFTAFTGVLMPRLSSYAADNAITQFRSLFAKSVSVLCIIAFPIMVYTFVFSSDLITLIAGEEFDKSALCFRIIIPNILIIGLEQIYITQVLMSLSKDKIVFFNSLIGATIGVVSNIFLVRHFQSIGSSYVWCVSELSVLCSALYFVSKYDIKLLTPLKKIIVYGLSAAPIALLLLVISKIELNMLMKLLIGAIILALYYFVTLYYIIKEELFLQVCSSVKDRIMNKSN